MDLVQYQIQCDKVLWTQFKEKIPRTTTINNQLIVMIEEFVSKGE